MEDHLHWLITKAPSLATPADALARLCERLRAHGVPVDRFWLSQTASHPLLAGEADIWFSHKPAQHRTLPYRRRSVLDQGGPVFEEAERDGMSRFRPAEHPRGIHGMAQELWDDGYQDVLVAVSGADVTHAFFATVATLQAGGFTTEQVEVIRRVMPALALLVRSMAHLDFAGVLARTYLGRDVGTRVAAGQVHRGEGEVLNAAIWFSDLRGFSTLGRQLPLPDVLALLDDAFEAQVAAVEAAGGDVLKFMGDGMLAVFRCTDGERAACAAALQAARDLHARVQPLNARRTNEGAPPIRYGVGLHLGDVMYGNIGAPHRLDFTVIGDAVNTAARLEGLCGTLGVSAVASLAFASACGQDLAAAGTFPLKGVGESQVFVVDGRAQG